MPGRPGRTLAYDKPITPEGILSVAADPAERTWVSPMGSRVEDTAARLFSRSVPWKGTVPVKKIEDLTAGDLESGIKSGLSKRAEKGYVTVMKGKYMGNVGAIASAIIGGLKKAVDVSRGCEGVLGLTFYKGRYMPKKAVCQIFLKEKKPKDEAIRLAKELPTAPW